MKPFRIVLLLSALFHSFYTHAQHETTTATTHSNQGNFRIGAAMGHAFLKKAFHENLHGTTTSAAALALDFDYWAMKRWAIGLHSDIIFENFIVSERSPEGVKELIEREHPIAVVPVILYNPFAHLILIGGVGKEFSEEKNLVVYRGGAEYGFKLNNDWELSLSAMYDIKHRTYDTWMLGFGICKWINTSHKHPIHH